MAKIKITLTEFVDFVTRSGTPKLTVVRQAKKRHAVGYSPQMDFYKPLRERLVALHKNEQAKASLDDLLGQLTDKKKRAAYPELIEGYKRFLGRKNLRWFNPPHGVWECAGLTVSIRPELGLIMGGTQHVVKLYFKSEKPSKLRMDTILQLMEAVLGEKGGPYKFGVLDVRNARLVSSTGFNPGLMPLLEGESQSFETIYDQVQLEAPVAAGAVE